MRFLHSIQSKANAVFAFALLVQDKPNARARDWSSTNIHQHQQNNTVSLKSRIIQTVSKAAKKRSLKYHKMRWLQKVRQALARIERVDPDAVILSFDTNAHFRLLNIRVWCLRYHISLDFILDFLLHRYFQNIRKASPYPNTKIVQLGVYIPALCGEASRRAVEQEVLRSFPANENEHMYKSQLFQKAADLKSHRLIKPTDNLQEDTKRYISTMKVRNQRLDNTSKFKRRPWRDNPWR